MNVKIISWNVNGLRAVYKKGFLKWLNQSQADIVCLQEIKAQKEQLPNDLINPKGYFSCFNSAERLGYAGTAIFTKQGPLEIESKIGMQRFDQEGRVMQLKYADFTLINVYLPHGGRGKENLGYKLEAYACFFKYLKELKEENIILVGDFNIAHQEIDLARPKQNQNNTMFTLAERKQIDKIIELGFTDTFRQFCQKQGHYTWWPYAYGARKRNMGWRIDYVFVSKDLIPEIKQAFILNKIKGSDHCPVGIEIS